jgi:hypothetical protein
MPIDPTAAQNYLEFSLEWDSEPRLTENKRETLLLLARAVDINGVSPGGTGYVETYTFESLNAAIAQGWEWKLAAAVELFAGDENEIYDHCLEMRNIWAGKVSGITIGGTQSGADSFAIENTAVF